MEVAGSVKSTHISRVQSALPPTFSSVALAGDGTMFSTIAVDTIAMKLWIRQRKSEISFVGRPIWSI
jgi:hypothetical protein